MQQPSLNRATLLRFLLRKRTVLNRRFIAVVRCGGVVWKVELVRRGGGVALRRTHPVA